MPVRKTIIGQAVSEEKVKQAKLLRKQMTPEERMLWKHLRTNKLESFHFRRQQIIRGFIVDFYCHQTSLIVEIDGDIHKQLAEYDFQREHILKELGFKVLRFTNHEVQTMLETVLEKIKNACINCCLSDGT